MVALIDFLAHGYGIISVSPQYATKPLLQRLFHVQSLVLIDMEGNELFPGEEERYNECIPNRTYIVVSENDVEDEQDIPKKFDYERMAAMNRARTEIIKEHYIPLHPHLYEFKEEFFVESFLEAVKKYKETKEKDDLLKILTKETETGIYSFQIFTLEFCRQLIEETEQFENSGLPVTRPNTMNNYGAVLDDFGFEEFFDELTDYISPFSAILYPDYGGDSLDHHHAFIVQYKLKEDVSLDFHYDESEVTLNLCLGRQFTGGSLYFQGLLLKHETQNESFELFHQPGKAVLHVGKHRHGANAILSGERYNLIVWFRSMTLRSQQHDHCTCHHPH